MIYIFLTQKKLLSMIYYRCLFYNINIYDIIMSEQEMLKTIIRFFNNFGAEVVNFLDILITTLK